MKGLAVHSILVICVLGFAVLWALLARAQTPMTTTATSMPATTTGPGKWYYYSSFTSDSIMAATETRLWFGRQGLVYYDMKTRQAHAITPMHGIEVELQPAGIDSVSSKGQVVISLWKKFYAWSPASDLQLIAQDDEEGSPERICFDLTDRLVLKKRLPGTYDPQWFVYDNKACLWGELPTLDTSKDLRQAVEYTRNPTIKASVCSGDRGYVYTITLENGKTLPQLRTDMTYYDKAYCDANGDIWVGLWRWNSVSWQHIVPPEYFPFETKTFQNNNSVGKYAMALDLRTAVLDSKTMTWRGANPAGDTAIYSYDSGTGTGFREVQEGDKYLLQQVKHTPRGYKILREVDVTDYAGMPEVRTSDGDWWWLAQCPRGNPKVLRLTDDGIKTYNAVKPLTSGSGRQLVVSPRGQLWLFDSENWLRYDQKQDKFVLPPRAESSQKINPIYTTAEDWPLDEFSFKFGSLTLSRVGSPGTIYVKKEGKWRYMQGADIDASGRLDESPFMSAFSGASNMICGNRMLLTCYGPHKGIYEYDSVTKQWQYLSDAMGMAGYDAQGRIIIATEFGVLVYVRGDGSAAPVEDPITRRFKQLLREMDDDSWKVREAASSKMRSMGPSIVELAQASREDTDLPLEVRTRLNDILEKLGPSTSKTPRIVPLLRQMHPLLTTMPAS